MWAQPRLHFFFLFVLKIILKSLTRVFEFDSEDGFRTGCRNVSHKHQSFSGAIKKIISLKNVERYKNTVFSVQTWFIHCDLTVSSAAVFIIWLGSFAIYKRKKYALFFHLDRFDCILQFINIQKYILKNTQFWAHS